VNKAELATDLRNRQFRTGTTMRQVLDTLTDQRILDDFITCCLCGQKLIKPTTLRNHVQTSQTTREFVKYCKDRGDRHMMTCPNTNTNTRT